MHQLRVDKYSISGTANISDLADRVFGFHRLLPQELEPTIIKAKKDQPEQIISSEYEGYNNVLMIFKDRKFGVYNQEIKFKFEFFSNRYYTNDILSHNTTTATVVILHAALFNSHKRIALLANKGEAAIEILERIQLAYENLPSWLQQGVVVWNKKTVEFENGSKIVAAATTSASIRGKSCLSGDTRVCIEDGDDYYFVEINKVIHWSTEYLKDIQIKYKTINNITKDEFVGIRSIEKMENLCCIRTINGSIFDDGYLGSGAEICDTIKKYGPMNMSQEFIGIVNGTHKKNINATNRDLKILSQGEFRDFSGFKYMGDKPTVILYFDNTSIECTSDHQFLRDDGVWIEAKDIVEGEVYSGQTFISSIQTNNKKAVYDAINVEKTSSFYAEGLTAHNCYILYIDETAFVNNLDDFFASVYPTISSGVTT